MAKCFDEAIKIRRELENAKRYYVSYSGGKDSTAMLLRLLELGEPVDEIVFADTGFEFPELYVYIESVQKHIGRKITTIPSGEEMFKKWFYGKITRGKSEGKPRGFPLNAFPCWFTREAKVYPLQRHMVDAKHIYVGIAFDEKHRMGKDDFISYPLVEWGWTELDCVNYLNDKKLMNPLYKNFNRLGCYFCQKQPLTSLFVVWKLYPDLWKNILYWDEESRRISNHGIKPRPMKEYEKQFEAGEFDNVGGNYECVGCDAVASAFKMRQVKLDLWKEKRRDK